MATLSLYQWIPTVLTLLTLMAATAQASDAESPGRDNPQQTAAGEASSDETSESDDSAGSSSEKRAAILKGAKKTTGLITVHKKGNTLYAELDGGIYSSEFIVLISIARGISQGLLLGGMSWDDYLWKFQKIDDRVLVIRRNVRFRAKKGSPSAVAVEKAYTDSVLFSLPILAKGPNGGDLVDFNAVFMSDLPQISEVLPGFSFSTNKSSWASVKGFKDNLELEVAATYASSGRTEIESVPDSRGVSINVHYSISKLRDTGYTPRLADDRVGYFVTALKDFSKETDRDQFVRYIHRWDLRKADSTSELSLPKTPIIFWMEKTVPWKYRKPIWDGILEWNKAFEQAGFLNAIEVRQQPEDAEWDPEDINYNTFRWITADAGLALGPSRVNPYTGQILDADILFDASFLQAWRADFEDLTDEGVAQLFTGTSQGALSQVLAKRPRHGCGNCCLSRGMALEMAFGAAAVMAGAEPKEAKKELEKLIMQGLKEVAMHEVGHTLGLRHNFKGSRRFPLKQLNDPEQTKTDGIVASVMDYSPVNVTPKGWRQGDYYTTTIGPYDIWAIQYGYSPLSGGTDGEAKELSKIAARSGEADLAYATDDDLYGGTPDPDCNAFDLGADSLEYAEMLAQLTRELIPGLVDRMTEEGDDYSIARQAFNVLLHQHGRGMFFASRYIGGLYTSRSHKGDKDSRPPFTVVDVKKQRAALSLLEKQVFDDKPFDFPPELYRYLAPSRWSHWGVRSASAPIEFPIHDTILAWRINIIDQLMSATTLTRVRDSELMMPADQEAITTAELIERITSSVFSEVDKIQDGDYTNRKPAISSLRRDLQRACLRRLSNLAMGRTTAPDDCQSIAYCQLESLEARIEKLLKVNIRLDDYSRAHLQESRSRIRKVLDARLSLFGP